MCPSNESNQELTWREEHVSNDRVLLAHSVWMTTESDALEDDTVGVNGQQRSSGDQNHGTVVELLVDEHRGGRESDGREYSGHECRVCWHEALELVLVAIGVLREDGSSLKSTTADVEDQRLFGLNGQAVRVRIDAFELEIHDGHLVLVLEQSVHEDRMARN